MECVVIMPGMFDLFAKLRTTPECGSSISKDIHPELFK
jgi:hypothetical protein